MPKKAQLQQVESADPAVILEQIYGKIYPGERIVLAPPSSADFEFKAVGKPSIIGGSEELFKILRTPILNLQRELTSKRVLESQLVTGKKRDVIEEKMHAVEEKFKAAEGQQESGPIRKLDLEINWKETVRCRLAQDLEKKMHIIYDIITSLMKITKEDLNSNVTLTISTVKAIRRDPPKPEESWDKCSKIQSCEPQLLKKKFEIGPLLHVVTPGVRPMMHRRAMKVMAKGVTASTFARITFPLEPLPPWKEVAPEAVSQYYVKNKTFTVELATDIVQSMRHSHSNMSARVKRDCDSLLKSQTRDMEITFPQKMYGVDYHHYDAVRALSEMRKRGKIAAKTYGMEQGRKFYPSKWYMDLIKESVILKAGELPEIKAALQKLMKMAEMDEWSIKQGFSKLCLLTLSLPLVELASPLWQKTLMFMVERYFCAPGSIFLEWLKYRNVTYLVSQGKEQTPKRYIAANMSRETKEDITRASEKLKSTLEQIFGKINPGDVLVLAPPNSEHFVVVDPPFPRQVAGSEEITKIIGASVDLLKQQRGGQDYLENLRKQRLAKDVVDAETALRPRRPAHKIDMIHSGVNLLLIEKQHQETIEEFETYLRIIIMILTSLLNMDNEILDTSVTLHPDVVKKLRRISLGKLTPEEQETQLMYEKVLKKLSDDVIPVSELRTTSMSVTGPILRVISKDCKPMNPIKAAKLMASGISKSEFNRITFPMEKHPPWRIQDESNTTVVTTDEARIEIATDVLQSIRNAYVNMSERLKREHDRLVVNQSRTLDKAFRRKFYGLNCRHVSANQALEDMRKVARTGKLNGKYFDTFEEEKKYYPCPWYLDLITECVKLCAFDDKRVKTAFEDMLVLCELDEFTIPKGVPKLCLLAMSLPTEELATKIWQRSLAFIVERMFFAPESTIREWLKYRGLCYMMDREIKK